MCRKTIGIASARTSGPALAVAVARAAAAPRPKTPGLETERAGTTRHVNASARQPARSTGRLDESAPWSGAAVACGAEAAEQAGRACQQQDEPDRGHHDQRQ